VRQEIGERHFSGQCGSCPDFNQQNQSEGLSRSQLKQSNFRSDVLGILVCVVLIAAGFPGTLAERGDVG
jgi:hypothetical protein